MPDFSATHREQKEKSERGMVSIPALAEDFSVDWLSEALAHHLGTNSVVSAIRVILTSFARPPKLSSWMLVMKRLMLI
ncbi:MAG: hypothetical protein ACJAX5_002770 [Patiriisocius sp.]